MNLTRNHIKTIRCFDVSLTVGLIVLLFPLMLVIGVLCHMHFKSVWYVQPRIGLFAKPFNIYKFRSLPPTTPLVPTHLIPQDKLSWFSLFIRNSRIDELPQLINVLRGEMSLVGPRPCLENQSLIIKSRESNGIFHLKPGLTGLSQLMSVDMSDPVLLAEHDSALLNNFGLSKYFCILIATFFWACGLNRVSRKLVITARSV